MESFEGKTAAHLLDEVASRGYKVGYLHENFQLLKEAADYCNIKDVLMYSKDVGRAIAFLSLQTWSVPPQGPSQSKFSSDDRALLNTLDERLTEEVLATLRAKQCKCG